MQKREKPYALEDRTFEFAADVRQLIKKLHRTIGNIEDAKRLARSSGSVGANYIEANESLGKKDFVMHVRISRKEAKESRYWLRLLDVGQNDELGAWRDDLAREAEELQKILSAIEAKTRSD